MGRMPVPEPKSPEAMRAAQKVRNIFYFIAAANLVIIAIVLWPHPKSKAAPTAKAAAIEQNADAAVAEAAKNSPAMHEMERVNDKVIAAYNDHDAARFAEMFSP